MRQQGSNFFEVLRKMANMGVELTEQDLPDIYPSEFKAFAIAVR
jgi:hypothetical protein